MIIHSDTVTSRHIYDATDAATRNGGQLAGRTVRPTRMELRGSRKRARAFDVILTGNNSRGQNGHPRTPAATFDEWGYFLAYLFAIDPVMVTPYYDSAADFHAKTDGRYRFAPVARTA